MGTTTATAIVPDLSKLDEELPLCPGSKVGVPVVEVELVVWVGGRVAIEVIVVVFVEPVSAGEVLVEVVKDELGDDVGGGVDVVGGSVDEVSLLLVVGVGDEVVDGGVEDDVDVVDVVVLVFDVGVWVGVDVGVGVVDGLVVEGVVVGSSFTDDEVLVTSLLGGVVVGVVFVEVSMVLALVPASDMVIWRLAGTSGTLDLSGWPTKRMVLA
jgi:hypothetical protein